MSKQPFEKFINPKPSGGKKKEIIRQEKKKLKAEIRNHHDSESKQNFGRFAYVTKDMKANQAKEESNTEHDNYKKPERAPRKTTERFSNTDKPTRRSAAGPADDFKRKPSSRETSRPSDDRRKPSRDVATPRTSAPSARFKKPESVERAGSKDTASAAPARTLKLSEQMPLNKFIAHSGVCARREAAIMVKQGKVTVNGDIVYEPGYKVTAKDKVEIKGKLLHLQKNLVYILMNKPKDYITTAKDPEGRKTVFDLVVTATNERIYPVGRLDRNTTGVLLMTNDGELAQKLTHPSYEIKKVYEVKLDKPFLKKDFDAILTGVELEDGFVQADSLAYADSKDKSIVGIEIHSGRNRIVRRLFEFLGYDVRNLDRVMFANLTKKNVDRGKWRMLNDKEVRLLKFMNQSFVRKGKEAQNAEALLKQENWED